MGWVTRFSGYLDIGMGWIPENPTKSNTHKKIGYFYLFSSLLNVNFVKVLLK
jgi:hypothetical protein